MGGGGKILGGKGGNEKDLTREDLRAGKGETILRGKGGKRS